MGIRVFQVKKGSPTSWRVPQKEQMAIKPGTNERKFIAYYKGLNTVFVEDVTNKDLKPSKVPDFVLNPTRNKCELRFDDSDSALLKYLTTHTGNGKLWEEYSEDIDSDRKLQKSSNVKKALDIVSDTDELRIKALGLAIIGIETFGKSVKVIRAMLEEKAIESPKFVIDASSDPLYEKKIISSLAIASGIVKTNDTMTSLVWGDNRGIILNIATGEDYIEKLAKYINESNPQSQSILQEIGSRQKSMKFNNESDSSKLSAVEQENERLRKEIEALKGQSSQTVVAPSEDLDGVPEEIVRARTLYLEKFGKEVHWSKKNDYDWMMKKIEEE